MAGGDGTRIVEPSLDGSAATITDVDSKEIDFGNGDVRDRQRMLLAGTIPDSDVPVLAHPPTQAAYGLVTRPVAPVGLVAYNSVQTVQSGTVRPVVAFIVSDLGTRVLGFSATGDGDGRFQMDVNSVILTAAKIDFSNKNAERILPTGVPVPQGAIITISVRCDSPVSVGYEATIYMEVHGG